MSKITVEVVYADDKQQFMQTLNVVNGMPVRDVVAMSDVLMHFPEMTFDAMQVGIFSKKVTLETALRDGDRVEIYRALKIDPKESRRLRADAKKALTEETKS